MNDQPPAFLIFGAYGGIGSDLTSRLHASGARLALSGRNGERLSALAEEVGGHVLPGDATHFDTVSEIVTEAIQHFGRIDGVASCIGSLLLKPAHATREDEFLNTIHTNLATSFAILRAAARPMMKEGGSIVFVSTAAASIGLPNHEAIAAAKGGIDALVRSAAATYGRYGIRVNSVAPGLVETPMTERITGSEAARRSSEEMHALRRIGTPADVAGPMAWLLSEESNWVTGQTIGIDGGLGSVRSA